MYGIKLFIRQYGCDGVLQLPKWVKLEAYSYHIYLVSGGGISIDNTENTVPHAVFKKTLIERIVAKAYSDGSSNEGRKADGTFGQGNKCAEKLHINNEELYLLYMVCGNQVLVAEKLGICRQTVGRRLKKCDGILDGVKEEYGETRLTDPDKSILNMMCEAMGIDTELPF